MQAAGKAKRLKARPAVFSDLALGVIVQLLRDLARLRVDDLPHAAQVVADDQILFAFSEHGGGHVRFVGILVDAFELAVFLFAYTSVKRNVNVYLSACRFCNPF